MASVELTSVRSTADDAGRAADELCAGLGAIEPALLFVFAPREHDHVALNRALRERLPRARLVGASCPAQIDHEGVHHGTIVAAALSGDLEVGLGLGRRLSIEPIKAGSTAMIEACEDLGVRPIDLTKRHVGIVIDDGHRFKKEEMLVGMMEANPTVVVVGGGAGAGDSADTELLLAGRPTGMLHVDGRVATDAVVMALIKTDARWAALRTHGYTPTGRTIRITRVDASGARALEIDGRPAARRYAELLGVGVDELDFGKPGGFSRSPTALRVGREHFMRSPWKALPDGSILFANLLEEDTVLEIMRAGDLAAETARFFAEEIPERVGSPSAAILFQCNGRSQFYESLGRSADLSAVFRHRWAAGMNCWFETYCGINLNTTLNALAFGRS